VFPQPAVRIVFVAQSLLASAIWLGYSIYRFNATHEYLGDLPFEIGIKRLERDGHAFVLIFIYLTVVYDFIRIIVLPPRRRTTFSMLLSLAQLVCVVSSIISLVIAFSVLYRIYGIRDTAIADAVSNFPNFTSLYFSVITFTTTGYGDVVPSSVASRLLAMTESVMGYSILTLSISAVLRIFERRPRNDTPQEPASRPSL
jgi:voltage-gated potassium channel Kch